MRWIVRSLLFLFLLLGVEKVCHKATDGFALTKLAKAQSSAEDLLPPEEVYHNSYHYLGKGGQCYVFASADGNHVLKFFRKKMVPFSSKEEKKLEEVYQSCLIAKDRLREETGLLGLHVSGSTLLSATFILYDKLKVEHRIQAKEYSWILQQRAEPVQEHFLKLGAKGARAAYDQLQELLVKERKKGVFDNDANLSKNFGFVGEKPIQIDIGRFTYRTTRCKPKEEELYSWLKQHYPDEF